MPALNTPSVERLTLPNGLQVVLRHAPRLKRCAAALRVCAGSHDVPVTWPGLAHFLEHLFFLGTDRFPADDNLMVFVQSHGGQVNASTRERTTDFFFELPPSVFAQGLERLSEMLTHPRMALADQLREREVLHAEFIAWSRDAEARYQTTLLQPLSAQHPLRAFHAGNRYSLPVLRQTFQQALQDFYRRFYQAGQMVLSLAGPQSLDQLRNLATTYGSTFAHGVKSAQTPPPPLLNTMPELRPGSDSRRLHLIFACENLSDDSLEAVSFLKSWLTDEQSGGLPWELRKRGLINAVKVEPLYQFERQLLLNIEFALTEEGADKREAVAGLFFDWLRFFKAQINDPTLLEEYALLQARKMAVCGALERARNFSESRNLSDDDLKSLLEQLSPDRLLHPQPEDNLSMKTVWRLPASNPFLRLSSDDFNEGAIFVRWQLTRANPILWHMLDDSLASLNKTALQAGVSLAFIQYGNVWQLKLSGISAPMLTIVEHALRLLNSPDAQTLAPKGKTPNEPALMPIRQLLRRLPDYCLAAAELAYSGTDMDLPTLWANARWTSFTVGLSDQADAELKAKLLQSLGKPDNQPIRPTHANPGKYWVDDSSDGSESAVLLFCPTPSHGVQDEAAWRMLAHLGQSPFYQRLRVELQLGYAVFSGFRQIAGQGGWLFGVQSPSASADEIIEHLQTFIEDVPILIDAADLQIQQPMLSEQFEGANMDMPQLSEWLWQAHLAGHDQNYPQQLQSALLSLSKQQLLNAADQLNKATDSWVILSN